MKVRIGTRGSALALAQTNEVVARLKQCGHQAEIVVVHTRGDIERTAPLSSVGRGAFTDVFLQMLQAGEIDLAVHSAKDLPTEAGRDGFFCLPRADARDALLSLPDRPMVRVGTSSPRRAAAMLARDPHVQIVPVRGNVDTRLNKLRAGEVDALVLAAAGLDRLGADLTGLRVERLPVRACVPAACQAIIAVEGALGACLHDEAAGRAARIERTLQRALGGDCTGGVGCYYDGHTLFAQRNGVIAMCDYAGEESIHALAEELL